MGQIIVTPGPNGLVSSAGRILGQPLPENAVVADLPESGLELPPMSAALLRDGQIVIVPNWLGSGPWYDPKAPSPADHRLTIRTVKLSELAGATVDRLTAIEIDQLDFNPEAQGWAMQPRAETAAEKKAREKADADALAAKKAERKAARIVSAVQIRLAATEMGIRDEIEAVIAAEETPRAVKDYWEYSTEFRRSSPIWTAALPLIGATEADLDRLYDIAETK